MLNSTGISVVVSSQCPDNSRLQFEDQCSLNPPEMDQHMALDGCSMKSPRVDSIPIHHAHACTPEDQHAVVFHCPVHAQYSNVSFIYAQIHTPAVAILCGKITN